MAVHHKGWNYLLHWLGMEAIIDLEPKPGVDPSAAYLAEVTSRLEHTPAAMVLRATYQSPRPSQWVAEKGKIPAVTLPFTVGATGKSDDLFGLFDEIIERMLEARR